MTLLSLSLSLSHPPMSGTLFFDDGEHTEPLRIDVHGVDTPPGYEVSPGEGQEHWGACEEFLGEADRILRAILIPAEEVAYREQTVRNVIHSGILEGFRDDLEWQACLFEFARGGIDHDELERRARTIAARPLPNFQTSEDFEGQSDAVAAGAHVSLPEGAPENSLSDHYLEALSNDEYPSTNFERTVTDIRDDPDSEERP